MPRDLMEDKKLNFNQPLLSVRRCAPILPSENIVSRKTGHSPPVIPRLPPHRPELKSGPITNPGTVPFLWERTPGQPRQEAIPQALSINSTLPVGPKLPPGRYRSSKNRAVNVSTRDYKGEAVGDENVKNVEWSGEAMEEKDSDSVESDGAYTDALDSLSTADHHSFFLNCSMSGLNDVDDVEPSGNLSMDPQNRAFMMERFLAAAKAMASASEMKPHLHHTAPKKQQVVVEEKTEQVTQRVNPSLRCGPSFAMPYSHCDDDKDDQDIDDDYDHRNNLTTGCGLLPQFCLKSSICFLNLIPSMSVRTRTRTTEVYEGKTNLKNEKQGKSRSENHSTSTYCVAPVSLSDVEEKGIPVIPDESGSESFGSRGKGSKTFQELLAEEDSLEESESGGAVVEKTLYVDTIQVVESPHLRPCMPDAHYTHNAKGTLSTSEETDLSIQDLKKQDDDDADGEEKSTDTCSMDMPIVFCQNIEKLGNKDSKGLEKQVTRATILKQSQQFPASPPLPKSPSDSWLCRTLPSKCTKNPPLRSYLVAPANSQNHSSKAPVSSDHTKWETLVKTTQVQQHRQLSHSEGLLMTIPET